VNSDTAPMFIGDYPFFGADHSFMYGQIDEVQYYDQALSAAEIRNLAGQATTSTSVSCSPPTVGVGQSTSCTATVTDTGSGTRATPEGAVTFSSDSPGGFSAGSCTLSGSGATASCQVSYTASAVASGSHTITASYGGDLAHPGSTGSTTVTVTGVPPSTVISLSPASPDGQNGWYRSAVHVTVSASGSSVADTRCVLDPASPPASFEQISSGCAYAGTGADVTADGRHTIYAASEDTAGEKETPVSVSFKIDMTPPTVTCNAPPLIFALGGPGGRVSAAVSDATSGPAAASVSAPADVSSTGHKSVALTGYDNAGNQTTANCPYTVAAPPSVAITTPANGGLYAQGQVVKAAFSCSAYPGASVTACTGPVANGAAIDTQAPGSHSFTVSATDNLGSHSTQSVSYTVNAAPPVPVLSHVRQFAATWRESKAKQKHGPPVGTTFSFILNEPASVLFSFTQTTTGRKVNGRCVAQTNRNRKKPRCTLTTVDGTLTLTGHAGTNSVRFIGRISQTTVLKPGSYTVQITATNASGGRSAQRTLRFTIIK
jgi:Bacterial Ig-like domain (group 3)